MSQSTKTEILRAVTDPHLVALLRFLCGSDVYEDYFDLKARHAEAAAKTMLTSKPLGTAFDSYRDRPDTYGLIRQS